MFVLPIDHELKLALIEESFAPTYAELVATHKNYLSQWLAWPAYCRSEQDFRLFAQTMLHDYAEGKSITCALFYHDELVGNCSLQHIDPELGKARLGYWLAEDKQGHGIVTRAAAKLIEVAFATYQLDKLELAVATGNYASQQVAGRLGFHQEGIITRAENLNGRIVDHIIYGLQRTG